MKNYVLDSYALISYLEDEPGADEVSKIFEVSLEKHYNIYMCVVNWGEVYYSAIRVGGEILANTVLNTIENLPIQIIDVDKYVTLIAAKYKSNGNISYADCYAAAISKINNSILVTGDQEFKQLENDIKIKRKIG